MIEETRKRIIAKTISWRILSFILTFAVVIGLTSLVTTAFILATVVSASDLIIKTFAYYIHESVWEQTKFGKSMKDRSGCCVWLTGLPLSGKTTIARELKKQLKQGLYYVDLLDREVASKLPTWDMDLERETKGKNIKRIVHIASYISQKHTIICSFVFPDQKTRRWARANCNNFVEVYVKCSEEKRRSRDVKGELSKLECKYQKPENFEIVCYTDRTSPKDNAKIIMEYLEKHNLIK